MPRSGVISKTRSSHKKTLRRQSNVYDVEEDMEDVIANSDAENTIDFSKASTSTALKSKQSDQQRSLKTASKKLVLQPHSENSSIKNQEDTIQLIDDSVVNLDSTFVANDETKFAFKDVRFSSGWVDPSICTFDGRDISEASDCDRRGTYNLESTINDMSMLMSVDESTFNKKRSSIGQRISNVFAQKRSPPRVAKSAFKAKGKLEKKKNLEVRLRDKKSVTFDEVQYKKIKRTKMPDFARIHQRQFERSESIVEYLERTQERGRILMSGDDPSAIGNKTNEKINDTFGNSSKNQTNENITPPNTGNRSLLDGSKTPGRTTFRKTPKIKWGYAEINDSSSFVGNLDDQNVGNVTPPNNTNQSLIGLNTPGRSTLQKTPGTKPKDTEINKLTSSIGNMTPPNEENQLPIIGSKTPGRSNLRKTLGNKSVTSDGNLDNKNTGNMTPLNNTNQSFAIGSKTPGKNNLRKTPLAKSKTMEINISSIESLDNKNTGNMTPPNDENKSFAMGSKTPGRSNLRKTPLAKSKTMEISIPSSSVESLDNKNTGNMTPPNNENNKSFAMGSKTPGRSNLRKTPGTMPKNMKINMHSSSVESLDNKNTGNRTPPNNQNKSFAMGSKTPGKHNLRKTPLAKSKTMEISIPSSSVESLDNKNTGNMTPPNNENNKSFAIGSKTPGKSNLRKTPGTKPKTMKINQPLSSIGNMTTPNEENQLSVIGSKTPGKSNLRKTLGTNSKTLDTNKPSTSIVNLKKKTTKLEVLSLAGTSQQNSILTESPPVILDQSLAFPREEENNLELTKTSSSSINNDETLPLVGLPKRNFNLLDIRPSVRGSTDTDFTWKPRTKPTQPSKIPIKIPVISFPEPTERKRITKPRVDNKAIREAVLTKSKVKKTTSVKDSVENKAVVNGVRMNRRFALLMNKRALDKK